MTTLRVEPLPAFDDAAFQQVRALLEANQSRAALELLGNHDPRDRVQGIRYHALLATGTHHAGDFRGALREWLRTLHLTSQRRDKRPNVRICMADTLIRLGQLASAERVVQRCLAEIRAEGHQKRSEFAALSILARVHCLRGTLSLAVRLYESGLDLLGEGSEELHGWWCLFRVNFVHALIRLGDFSRADEMLRGTEARSQGLGLYDLTYAILARAELALERGDADGCERTLQRLDESVVGDNLRYRLQRLQYRAGLRMVQGRAWEALRDIEEALSSARTSQPMDDMLSGLLRLRASALLELDQPSHALESARESVAVVRGSDMLDHPAGLRVTAQCLARLGRVEEAKGTLAAAHSLLESTEFVTERRKLAAVMDTLKVRLNGAGASSASRPAPSGGRGPLHRLPLRDGRCFVTSDRELADRIRSAAQSRLPVLLEGETGTGKELVARLLHELGSAREGPFVVVDCTTLTEALAEAELFGAARGAYTGALADRMGLVAAADGGTLLFDELPELSLPAQSKLLRLLQEGTYRRVGEAQPRRVRVRVIATTNQDSERLLARGALKPDLFFRLHGYRIRLRPLRERSQDVEALAREFAATEGLEGISTDAMAEIQSYEWPGNARQLEMFMRVAASKAPAGTLDRALVARFLQDSPRALAPTPERQRLEAALGAHGGNVAATARSLHMSRQGLYKALRRNGLI